MYEVHVRTWEGAIVESDGSYHTACRGDTGSTSSAAEEGRGDVGEVQKVIVIRGVGAEAGAAVVHHGAERSVEALVLQQPCVEGAITVDQGGKSAGCRAHQPASRAGAAHRMWGRREG